MLPFEYGSLETRLEILESALQRYPKNARDALITEVYLHDTLWDGDYESTRPTVAGSGCAPRNFTLSDALRAPHLK